MQKYLDIYNETNKKLSALDYAMIIVSWDSETIAPSGCFEQRGKKMSVISEMSYKLRTDKAYIEAIDKLFEQRDKLDAVMSHEIKMMKKSVDQMRKIPMDEYVKYSELSVKSVQTYYKAKVANDYEAFKPYLKEVLAFTQKQTKWLETDKLKGYDVLLDMYEEGFTQAEYDKFFNALKTKLVPFVKKVAAMKPNFDTSWLTAFYPADKQKKFAEYLEKVMCFDLEHGLMGESEHPFTTGTGNYDVRVTNHYYENNFTSSIFSAIHEMGHGTYERQVADSLQDTMSGGGVSMGMHESQSRFYENIVGRSYEFWQRHYPELVKTFPEQLKNVSLDTFYKGINLVECSLIRTDADELTYPLHIMVRYELEKRMIKGEVNVENLPTEWNKMYKEYLGVTVPTDKQGCLQDMHWSGGSIGYFPTYALGSAYAAQFYHKMGEEMDMQKAMGKENLADVNAWLKEKVHKFGASRDPKDILFGATGEEFNPDYYINYLIEKYKKVYDIK